MSIVSLNPNTNSCLIGLEVCESLIEDDLLSVIDVTRLGF